MDNSALSGVVALIEEGIYVHTAELCMHSCTTIDIHIRICGTTCIQYMHFVMTACYAAKIAATRAFILA